MKKIFFVIAFSMMAGVLLAQSVQIQKSTFVPGGTGIYNLNESVATNTKTGQTLVVWENVNGVVHQINAKVLNSAGKPLGPQFVLVAGPSAAHPSVVYNPVRNEFLLGYDSNPTFSLVQTNIFIQRLNSNGRKVGAFLLVTSDTVSAGLVNYLPRLIFNPKKANYNLIWIREIMNISQAGPNNGMVGIVITPTATLGGSVTVIRPTVLDNGSLVEPVLLDGVVHPITGKLECGFVQAIAGTSSSQVNYFLAIINPDYTGISDSSFTKINTAPFNVSGFVWGLRMSFQSTGTGFLVFVDNANVKRRALNSTGHLGGPATPAFHSPKNNTKLLYPVLAMTNGAAGLRGILIGTQNPFNANGLVTVWCQPIDGNGLALGPSVKVDTTSATTTALGGGTIAFPQPITSPTYRFGHLYALTSFIAPGQTFQGSALEMLNLTLSP